MTSDNKLKAVKILLVDDDPAFLHLLKVFLTDVGVQHLRLADSYAQGLQAYRQFDPDICIFDIVLGKGQKSGIDLATIIRKKDKEIPIVFLTSHFHDDFYEKARPVCPSSFMNKELSRVKLLQALDLCVLQIESASLSSQVTRKEKNAPSSSTPYFNSSQFFFKVGDMYKGINIKEINYFFADNKLTYARVENRNFPTVVQLKVLSEELGNMFLRCHKKYLVNIDAIESILIREGKIKIGNELIPIGYAYRKDFIAGIKLLK